MRSPYPVAAWAWCARLIWERGTLCGRRGVRALRLAGERRHDLRACRHWIGTPWAPCTHRALRRGLPPIHGAALLLRFLLGARRVALRLVGVAGGGRHRSRRLFALVVLHGMAGGLASCCAVCCTCWLGQTGLQCTREAPRRDIQGGVAAAQQQAAGSLSAPPCSRPRSHWLAPEQRLASRMAAPEARPLKTVPELRAWSPDVGDLCTASVALPPTVCRHAASQRRSSSSCRRRLPPPAVLPAR